MSQKAPTYFIPDNWQDYPELLPALRLLVEAGRRKLLRQAKEETRV